MSSLLPVSNNIRDHDLDGHNKPNRYYCEVDKNIRKFKPQFNIPLQTALYIIKDVDENIKTDLLVKSNINSPPFFYKKIIFKPLTNLLVKEAVSPFNFLINFLGQVSHTPKDIPFDIYRTDFILKQFLLIHPLITVRKAKLEMALKLQPPYTPIPTKK